MKVVITSTKRTLISTFNDRPSSVVIQIVLFQMGRNA